MLFKRPLIDAVVSTITLWSLFVFICSASASPLVDNMSASDVLGQTMGKTSAVETTYVYNGVDLTPNAFGFSGQTGLALDPDYHRLFVADYGNNRVLVYNLNSDDTISDYEADYVIGQPNFRENAQARTQSSVYHPYSLLYDRYHQVLYVGEDDEYRIMVFDVSTITNGQNAFAVLGQSDFTSNTYSEATESKFRYARGMAYDPARDLLFVTDINNHRVLVFDVASITNGEDAVYVLGQNNFSAISPGVTSSKFYYPEGLAYDETTDRLFVSDVLNNRVLVFDLSGAITNGMAAEHVLGHATFTADAPGLSASAFNYPRALTLDETNSRLFVADQNNKRVLAFDISTISDNENAVSVLGQTNLTSNTGYDPLPKTITSSYGLAYAGASKSLFVSDVNFNRVLGFDVTSITDGEDAVSNLGQISGLVSPTPSYVTLSQNMTPNDMGVNTPRGMAIDEIHHRMFLVDMANNRVLVFNLASDNTIDHYNADYVLGQPDFRSNNSGTTASTLYSPNALAYDSTGQRLFVADWNNSRVLVFDVTSISNGEAAVHVLGQSDFISSSTGDGASLFYYVTGLALDEESQRLFVSDYYNNRVLVFDVSAISDGEPAIHVLGQPNFTSAADTVSKAGLSMPDGLVYDSSKHRLYISDAGNSRVIVHDVSSITDGQEASYVIGQPDFTTISGAGATDSSFCSNAGLAIDPTRQRLFVADIYCNRVLAFDVSSISNGESASHVIGQATFTSSDSAITQQGLTWPQNVAYSGETSTLFVSDSGNNRITVYDIFEVLPTPTVTPTAAPSATATSTPTPIIPDVTPTSPPVSTPSATATPIPPVVNTISPDDRISDRTPTITGTATAGSVVHIYVDGVEVGTTIVGQDGQWSYTFTSALLPGARQITAAVEGGGVSAPITLIVSGGTILDFNGDGSSEIVGWRKSGSSVKYAYRMVGTTEWHYPEVTGTRPIAADYDGDGKWDAAAVRQTRNGMYWSILPSASNSLTTIKFGDSEDTAVGACRFQSASQSSLVIFKEKQRVMMARTLAGTSTLRLHIRDVDFTDFIGCADVNSDSLDELVFTIPYSKTQRRIISFDARGTRHSYGHIRKFSERYIVRKSNDGSAYLTGILPRGGKGRNIILKDLSNRTPLQIVGLSNVRLTSNGIFLETNGDSSAYLVWTTSNNTSNRKEIPVGEEESLFTLPGGFSLLREQNIIRAR